jgi:hypothetical protein
MTNLSQSLLFLLMFAGVVAAGLTISMLLSVISGWRSLARSYRGRLPHVEASARAGASIGGVPHAGMTIAVGPYGIGLVPLPWDVGSPPLALPWRAIRSCRRNRLFGRFDRFTFWVNEVEVTATGAAAQLLDDAWQTWALQSGVPLLVEYPAERVVERPAEREV